jgi:pimeloyl-ACP methyl ester carboxylesterase
MAHEEEIPVVLVHGWGGSFRHTWQEPGIDALLHDSGRSVVGIDLLGHGNAEKPHAPEAYDNLSQWLLDQIPDKFPTVDIIGFSLGALTTLGALLTQPERFRRVILAGIGDGVFGGQDNSRHQRIVDALEGNGALDDTFSQMFVQYAHQPGNDSLALTAIMKRPPSPPITTEQLASISTEVLVVIGDKDFAGPSDLLASSFPQGKLCVLKNTDHFATTESFSFIDALLDFMMP